MSYIAIAIAGIMDAMRDVIADHLQISTINNWKITRGLYYWITGDMRLGYDNFNMIEGRKTILRLPVPFFILDGPFIMQCIRTCVLLFAGIFLIDRIDLKIVNILSQFLTMFAVYIVAYVIFCYHILIDRKFRKNIFND